MLRENVTRFFADIPAALSLARVKLEEKFLIILDKTRI